MTVVVDTDIVSFLFKHDTRAVRYLPHLAGQAVVVSFMTVAELDRWALEHAWGPARVARTEQHVQQYTFAACDRSLCRTWAEVMVGARRAGRPMATADAWIAATAVALGAPLITHNPGDYAGVTALTVITESP